ncbi:Selenocysteine lyase [Rubrobacter radiotolerans]|uniref:Aminotransferase class V-fold PLP-dependent enzyme n=1 Tax=Rubrobacter radiotolerans TaxID=42256 RepID=A0A023X0P0_RUBRA|nr:aminotransferase class V-fold PLP-dependent enzyme [Rubrobacter radiotolerans]AHY45786.1 Selenocysteine lyase [Rubrobacter radiotolerans]MDX5893201.1 aminotransferase class V-fold PLP-dependent enzyme [Rubrobacter radiotolerans]SMC03257.1 L-cysteine/cystine lyase [Rubrobacter radiotolerans DSM 5868]
MASSRATDAKDLRPGSGEPLLERGEIFALKDNDFVYLNSGGSGPPPESVRAAMRAADDLVCGPAYLQGAAFYARCAEVLVSAKEALSGLLGGSPDSYALTNNTSHGMSLGVAGVDWRPGDEIITTTTEHPGCLVPLHAARRRYGVTVRYLEPPVTVEKVEDAITDRTRLVALSHVDWTNGYVLPLEGICSAARERDVLTLVDGAQSVGNIETDIPATGADLYAFTGHKWLLGPEGAGALYVCPECDLPSTSLGYASVADPQSFDVYGDYALKAGAGRFEASTMSPALAGGLAAAANAARERGEAGFAEIRRKANLLMDLLSRDSRITLRSPRPAECGLVSFEVEGLAAKEVVARLLERRFVLRFLPEPAGYVRASTHLFVADAELEALARALAEL